METFWKPKMKNITKVRGVRDGTGPHKDSFQKKGSNKGKRKEAGEKCPFN